MQIQTKAEILSALQDSSQRMQVWFSAIPASEYFVRSGEVWSASDNVDHVIKAIEPIILAMKLPRLALQARFGKVQHVSRSYDEICRVYQAEIAKGAKASGRFLPDETNVRADSQLKETQLQRASKVVTNLIAACEKWDEDALDQCQLPHPLIGNLTMREMLFFTIHHNLRHASREGD